MKRKYHRGVLAELDKSEKESQRVVVDVKDSQLTLLQNHQNSVKELVVSDSCEKVFKTRRHTSKGS